MGTFEVEFGIAAMQAAPPASWETVRGLVDTGATYSILPAETLRRIGITPIGTLRIRVADGRLIEKTYGGALLLIEGRTVATTVFFGENGDVALLGVTALELAALGVDPVAQKLVAVIPIQA